MPNRSGWKPREQFLSGLIRSSFVGDSEGSLLMSVTYQTQHVTTVHADRQLVKSDHAKHAPPASMDYVSHECFEAENAEERFLGSNGEWLSFSASRYSSDNTKLTSTGFRYCLLKPAEESELFLKYNYIRYRINELLNRAGHKNGNTNSKKLLELIEAKQQTKSLLVRSNMGLVCVMAKRTQITGLDYDDLISEGSMALLRSIEKFDVSRGFKFSTYACRAILKSFCRLAGKIKKHRERFPTENNAVLERISNGSDNGEQRHQEVVKTLTDILTNNLAGLSDVEQIIIRERFALSGSPKKRTLCEVAKMVSLTDERVRQIQNGALCKLRVFLEKHSPTCNSIFRPKLNPPRNNSRRKNGNRQKA